MFTQACVGHNGFAQFTGCRGHPLSPVLVGCSIHAHVPVNWHVDTARFKSEEYTASKSPHLPLVSSSAAAAACASPRSLSAVSVHPCKRRMVFHSCTWLHYHQTRDVLAAANVRAHTVSPCRTNTISVAGCAIVPPVLPLFTRVRKRIRGYTSYLVLHLRDRSENATTRASGPRELPNCWSRAAAPEGPRSKHKKQRIDYTTHCVCLSPVGLLATPLLAVFRENNRSEIWPNISSISSVCVDCGARTHCTLPTSLADHAASVAASRGV